MPNYNQLEQLPSMPYNIISNLLTNNQIIWKLLYYPTSDALDKANLTQSQKVSLIYNGEEDSDDYRVFMQPLTDDAFEVRCAMIRVFPLDVSAENQVISKVSFAIEVLSHVKIDQLNNYTTRNVNLVKEITSALNGKEIGGVGLCYVSKARFSLNNNRNFIGYTLYMTNYAV